MRIRALTIAAVQTGFRKIMQSLPRLVSAGCGRSLLAQWNEWEQATYRFVVRAACAVALSLATPSAGWPAC